MRIGWIFGQSLVSGFLSWLSLVNNANTIIIMATIQKKSQIVNFVKLKGLQIVHARLAGVVSESFKPLLKTKIELVRCICFLAKNIFQIIIKIAAWQWGNGFYDHSIIVYTCLSYIIQISISCRSHLILLSTWTCSLKCQKLKGIITVWL